VRIKSLQITGFKSFVDKTTFGFRSGITAIVGPNGCGKSNVVDAIRWAMGEQSPRRLRGKGMEDVIFTGSEARAQVGMAEVVLSFDNASGLGPPQFASFAEIQVARRLYRSGESEYLINKVPCRLRDVQDFFRDTGIGTKGYTIVEQGRIAEIVSARPEERRILIEEAAGISKYKARRQEAERKLEATEQNLVRVSDVLGEIRRQISSIERQARKAARYKRLRELLRVLELSLAADDRQDLLAEMERGRGRLATLRDATTAAEARLGERESALAARRLELAEWERSIGQANEALFQIRARIKDLEGQIGYDRRERAALAETIEARGREREQLAAQAQATEEEAACHADELRAVERALADEDEALARAEAAAGAAALALRTLERQRDAESTALVEVLTRIARSEDRLAGIEDRRAELDRRLRSTDEQLEVQQTEAVRADHERRALEEGLRNLLAERDRMMVGLRTAFGRVDQAGATLRIAFEALRERHEWREERRARLASLRELLERHEDLGQGARHLLGLGEAERTELGLHALVRDVLEAEPAVECAVEAVLAEHAEGLVVARAEGALEALARLRRAGAGRGVLVLQREADAQAGFVPLGEPLAARVRPRPGYEGVVQALLGSVNLVADLGEVLRVYGGGRLPCTFVTPAGDVLTPAGVLRGGGQATEAGALACLREVRELQAEAAALDREVETLEASHAEAERALARAQDELENLRNRHHTAALAVASHEKDLERTRERVKALGEAQEGRVAERSELLAELEALGAEAGRLGDLLGASREERARRQRELDGLGLRLGSAGRELSRLETLATERRVQRGGRAEARDRLRGAVARAEATLGETRAWIVRREEEIGAGQARREALARAIAAAEAALGGVLEEEEAARRVHEERCASFEARGAAVRALEEETREMRSDLEVRRDEARQAELALRELELRLEHLEAAVRDRWSVDLASWKMPAPALEPAVEGAGTESQAPAVLGGEEGDEEESDRDARREARELAELVSLSREERSQRVPELRQRIEAIGEVNLGAIEEHEELRERYRFLSEQKADLEASVAQLREAIARINRTSRKRFRETFDAVNERFAKNFPRLFRGGKASLGLTDSEDVLEAGIEIMAQPPGKRLQSVNLLSGGEKTMTAIALLVSVFQVRPSPFFLLDEVDAALDDANVGRFNEIVSELARESQFLLITHNKRTIEVADVLYGVTMEEKGVSKLVSVELH
jgi:chromosome segregation protein